jgi:hypothetical protein
VGWIKPSVDTAQVDAYAPPVAALRDMVWDIHCDHSIESTHDRHDNSSYFAMLELLPR